MILVDANIFLEVELAGKRTEVCKSALRKVRTRKEKALTTDFIVDSIVIVMERYGKTWPEIRKFLSALLGYKGLRVHSLSFFDRIIATEHMRKFGLDFDDATTYQAMLSFETMRILSYDKHFDAIPGVERILP